jgi:biopolymer transport protein ExbB
MNRPLGVMLFLAVVLCVSGAVFSADMRTMYREAEKKKAEILNKALSEEKAARKEAQESRKRIFEDQKRLMGAISGLKNGNEQMKNEIERLGKELVDLQELEETLNARLTDRQAKVQELLGFVRTHARDLESVSKMSPQSALIPNRHEMLSPLTSGTGFPGMEEIRKMIDLLFDEIRLSGEVRIQQGNIVDRIGEETKAKILMLGNFTAAYRLGNETGFLLYSEPSQRLLALSKLPNRRISGSIERYMEGEAMEAPIDISRGAALRQLTHRLNIWEQIPMGGPIVYPIVGIFLLAVVIIIERSIYLLSKSVNAENLMKSVCKHAENQDWDACNAVCETFRNKPIPKVLLAGIKFKDVSRLDLENVLQEAILNEIPRLERFLSTLGMLAAIAPLLGLLGTVTGMINTFNVITFFGTGDPRMMSGGISEALITTMLGLTVAIPIMLSHTLLTRKVENMISQMEEKAVAFVNTLFKSKS